MDGTFKVVRAFVRSGDDIKQVPLAFALMSSRRKGDYKAVLTELKKALPTDINQQECVMDYEPALWQAIPLVFPGKQLKGDNEKRDDVKIFEVEEGHDAVLESTYDSFQETIRSTMLEDNLICWAVGDDDMDVGQVLHHHHHGLQPYVEAVQEAREVDKRIEEIRELDDLEGDLLYEMLEGENVENTISLKDEIESLMQCKKKLVQLVYAM
ncbi:Hypp6406 [Branchiostoma lanceolatum]|uniref:Hypp6406 protein n=1 Tax=Branchiostoma lanceolatum TaxID=7740 RepID=A0A8K0E9F0_BRALA|nr:Hypp6406 [Branchiostoma lanceolatum]